MVILIIVVLVIAIVGSLSSRSSPPPPPRPRRCKDAAPQPPDEPSEHLEETIMVAITDKDADVTMSKIRIYLQEEVFTPPLPEGTFFKLIFTGTCAVQFFSGWYCFDACYKATSGTHNYTDRHHRLKLDCKAADDSPLEADRAAHQYTFVYRGTGARLSVLLESPIGNCRNAYAVENTIHLTVRALSPTEVSQLGLDAEERKREADARQIIEEIEQQACELAVAAYQQLHLLDPEYRPQFAKEHHTKISTHLKDKWLADYREVLADEALRTLLEERHPHVMPVLTARMEVLSLAERLPFDEQRAQAQLAEERARRARAERIADLVRTYHEFEHYGRDQWIADYVAIPKHQQELRANWREIVEKDREFHSDKAFIDELRACSPGTYLRATWEMRAFALADKLSATPQIKPKKTLDEVLAGIERFRRRELHKIRVKVEDHKAFMMQNLELLQEFIADLNNYPLDEDQREDLIKEFKERLLGGEEEHGNGFKQL